ncbi:MAG TPA: Gfo/Idh/MocA family oxidoreductase [Bauldia sp.]|nr:Gfo/Idh/MocA family oxidoreductase [Bauldia sp.]
MTAAIGLVGAGAWGRLILRDAVELGAAVHVVIRESGSRDELTALGAASVGNDAHAISGMVDGFIVATPTSTHAEVIDALLGHGKPVFVEKPLTDSVADARRLVDRAGGLLFVMDKWRYHPGVEKLRDLAVSGELGPVRAVRTRRLGWGTSHADVDPVWTLLPHDLAIVHEILGHLPPVLGAFGTVAGRSECDLMARLGGSGGPGAVIEVATSQPLTERSVVVVGDKGAAQLADSYADHLLFMPGGRRAGLRRDPERIPISADLPLRREVAAFLAYLSGGPPPRAPAGDGLLVVERVAEIRAMAGLPERSLPLT